MANLVEGNTWEPNVYQLETNDPVMGGVDGIDNLQAKQLAARTQYLKAQQETHAAAADPHPQYLTQAEADALIESRVGDYSIDTGTANAKVVALNPAIAAYVGNFSGAFKNALANDGACTINFGGGVVPLVADAGAALVNGDLPAGAVVSYQYIHADGKAYVTSLVASQGDARYVQIANVATAAGDPTGADNSTKPASTGWIRNAMANIASAAGFAALLATNGYIKFPTWLGGLILQWGGIANVGGSQPVTFPIAFPNALFGVISSGGWASGGNFTATVSGQSTTGFTMNTYVANTGVASQCNALWFGIGK